MMKLIDFQSRPVQPTPCSAERRCTSQALFRAIADQSWVACEINSYLKLCVKGGMVAKPRTTRPPVHHGLLDILCHQPRKTCLCMTRSQLECKVYLLLDSNHNSPGREAICPGV
jgi:hypothetical protein